MRAARLNSSMIERICYDEEEESLSIWFRATGRYIYYDVPASIYEALKAAASAGLFFNERIKGRYRCAFDPERRRFRPQRAV
ncbi:MAG TPA: KTSC domain-containing protein [Allosphingosinicella sp.]|nr:KTSC domain-containing protein [Allosphingosinicella sp.]